MQDLRTGSFVPLDPDVGACLDRIFRAGNRTLPIFQVGEEILLKNGRFEVLALDGNLLVLRGLPREDA